jgi:hypothetical protein
VANLTFLSCGGDGIGLATALGEFNVAGTGATSIDTTVSHTGSRSIKCDATATPASAYVVRGGPLADAGRRISAWVRFGTAFGGSNTAGTGFIRALILGTTEVFSLGINNLGQLRVSAPATPTISAVTGSTLSLGIWYQITVSYVITSSSNWTVKVFLNGVLDITATNANGTLTTVVTSNLRLGWTGTAPQANALVWFDDIYVDDGTSLDYPGDIRNINKKPAALGSTNAWDTLVGSGTNRWDRVSEEPVNTTNGITQAGTGQADELFTVQGERVGDTITGTQLGIGGWIHVHNSGTTGTPAIYLNGVATAYTSTAAYKTITAYSTTTTYPSGNNAIGARSNGTTNDTLLAECGIFIAYLVGKAPPPYRPAFRVWNRRVVT